ncbi:hypothetical protein RJE46_15485 [Cedecea neteri]|uniref:hypothetical protein n=1 Tax=Cedecea neteri TaxID=158822 RepID=UPI0028936527|nr:hypothetical protein [Cedecea neteri]WNJ78029.1 hypothetical protein RJE46_15485 [Cedecea neteri]
MEYLLAKPEEMAQARRIVRVWVEINNTRCPHLSLKYKTADEVSRRWLFEKYPSKSGLAARL